MKSYSSSPNSMKSKFNSSAACFIPMVTSQKFFATICTAEICDLDVI